MRYLTSNRPFLKIFNIYLKQLAAIFQSEAGTNIHSKVMKYLCTVVEVDLTVLAHNDIKSCIKVGLTDKKSIRKLKLIRETFQQLWFSPIRNQQDVRQHVQTIIDVLVDAQKQNYTWLENLVKEFLQTNNKQSIDNKKKVCEQRKDVLKVIQDIINELVESILKIESANDQVSSNKMVATFIGLYALFLCTNFCFLNAGITSAADLVERSNIKIQCRGNYVPVEIDVQANAANEQTLELVIESQNEKENKKFHFIRSQILKDLNTFESHDEPINDSDSHQVIVFGSLFNSLPPDIFDTERYLLGERNCNIEKIKNSLACDISVNSLGAQRYSFIIRHNKKIIMELATIQIQALVQQAHQQYLISYANKIGQDLIGRTKQNETITYMSSSNSNKFQASTKRKRTENDDEEEEEEEAQQQLIKDGPIIIMSDHTDDGKMILDKTRSNGKRTSHLTLPINLNESFNLSYPILNSTILSTLEVILNEISNYLETHREQISLRIIVYLLTIIWILYPV
ncbi:unnamed protein product [Rotaria sp. Silwood1]|nr:unnamed protein product [Rotaria sp. Silwood1]